jgi:hypothetical protein
MYAKTKVRRSRKDAADKLLDQLDILKYNNWPLEIYENHRRQIEQLDPHKPRGQTDEEKYTAYQAFKEALISYYAGVAVVDPTGAEIKWDTMKAILELRQQRVIVDVMFNFMCAALRRQKKKACEETPNHAFDEFFGGNHWRQCCQKRQTFGECLHDTYIQNIKNAGYVVYTTSIWKNQLWHYHFDLILKERDAPHPWVQSYEELSNWLKKMRETDLVNIITGRLITEFTNDKSRPLTDFM